MGSPSTSLRAGFRLRSAVPHFAQDDRVSSFASGDIAPPFCDGQVNAEADAFGGGGDLG